MNEPQPPPQGIPRSAVAVWDLVREDARYEFYWALSLQRFLAESYERDQVGLSKYGTRLQTDNGRNALVDAMQEAMDLVVYLRQAKYECRDQATKDRLTTIYHRALGSALELRQFIYETEGR